MKLFGMVLAMACALAACGGDCDKKNGPSRKDTGPSDTNPKGTGQNGDSALRKISLSEARNVCEQQWIIQFNAGIDYCEKYKAFCMLCKCSLKLQVPAEQEEGCVVPEDLNEFTVSLPAKAMACEGEALEDARRCLDNPKVCEECGILGLMLECGDRDGECNWNRSAEGGG